MRYQRTRRRHQASPADAGYPGGATGSARRRRSKRFNNAQGREYLLLSATASISGRRLSPPPAIDAAGPVGSDAVSIERHASAALLQRRRSPHAWNAKREQVPDLSSIGAVLPPTGGQCRHDCGWQAAVPAIATRHADPASVACTHRLLCHLLRIQPDGMPDAMRRMRKAPRHASITASAPSKLEAGASREQFPETPIMARIDRDTTRVKSAHQRLAANVSEQIRSGAPSTFSSAPR